MQKVTAQQNSVNKQAVSELIIMHKESNNINNGRKIINEY